MKDRNLLIKAKILIIKQIIIGLLHPFQGLNLIVKVKLSQSLSGNEITVKHERQSH